jgi:HK97 family phage major capsid protein
MAGNFDFGGIATKYGIRCEDGLVLAPGAFKGCDGKKVPLVWNHGHNDVENVIGHAILEERGDCVYAHCKLNNSKKANHTRECLANNDLDALSIFANKLQRNGSDVKHGIIREVSVVLGGCNPGAVIDRNSVAIAHGIDPEEIEDLDEAVIYHGMTSIDIEDDDEYIQHASEEDEPEQNASSNNSQNDKTVAEVFDSMTKEQQDVCYYLIGAALEQAAEGGEENEETEEETNMKHNVFNDAADQKYTGPVLSQADRKQILTDIKRYGSLSESIKHHMEDENGVLAHAVTPANYPTNEDGSTQTYGIANIDWLFPDVKNFTNGAPEFIMRDQSWANKLLSAVHHTPFSRVKTMFADITADEARAKGYIKGKEKVEEVFTLLKRKIDPQTIYKKQKFDRDDIVDITDFDVVAWVKQEMRGMLNEEIARAILIGDGRSSAYDDKISEDHIKPVYNDAALFTIRVKLPYVAGETEDARAKRVIRAAIKARIDYKGSGNPTMYTSAQFHTDMLLLEDSQGYPLYKTDVELATKCRVKEIEEVELLQGVNRSETVDGTTTVYDLAAIIFNPTDYNVGTDRGGEINSFEQFDIDYNQQKYLMETRVSGALVRPKSAIVIEIARS